MRTDSPTADSFSPTQALHTLDLSSEDLAFLSSLIVAHIACLNALLRTDAAGVFDALTLDRLHGEVRMGATLLGRFPLSRKDAR